MFLQAKAVFPCGKADKLNVFAVFRAKRASLAGATLYVTAADFYQVYVDGRFVAFGPARTAEGYARVDALSLDALGGEGEHEIVIAVCRYGVRCLSTVLQDAFLAAEVRVGSHVLLATGKGEDFTAHLPECHKEKTDRYSMQRHFGEIWDFRKDDFLSPLLPPVPVEERPMPQLLPRRAPYPFYEDVFAKSPEAVGKFVPDGTLAVRSEFYSEPIPPEWGRFSREEVLSHPYEYLQAHRQEPNGTAPLPLTLTAGDYALFDFGRIETGFILLDLTANATADLVVGWSEESVLDGRFAFTDMHAHNALEIMLGAGEKKHFTSFEPYVMKTLILAVREGEVTLGGVGVKSFAHDTRGVELLKTGNATLDAVYRGGVRTFSHNALDIYMDCPSRERAGWLCDSYFTAKTEYALFGETAVEDAFLENYRLFKNKGEYPEGVLPMCFPSDARAGKFIPQWTMWYILEVEEYVNRRGHADMREAFRPTVEALLRFYARHKNEDGLLECLPGWNFVEWSRANKWTQDVSYPTNFLYAKVLDCAYALFGGEEYKKEAEAVRKKAVEQSFFDGYFHDHAIRGENGALQVQKDASEACQYYAILFGGIDMSAPEFAHLWHLVTRVFGAVRKGDCPEIIEVNAFIGAYLRLEALLKMKEYDLVLCDIVDFFGEMEKETGTLWEYRQRHGSRDHGFASFALVAMREALEARPVGV